MTNKTLPKILIVDDEKSVLDAVKRVLRLDFEVMTADSGDQALKLLKKNTDCAVILSDYKMPKMTGIDLLTKAKHIAPAAVRCILSGQIDIKEISEAINTLQIHRFLLKPWDNDYLRIQMLEAAQTHKTLEERNHLRILAVTDTVTGLTNHRYFQEQLIAEINAAKASKTSMAIIMIDVDHFKEFNDQHGHPEGDRLLSEFANRIYHECSESGSVSRYGGEEFSVILPKHDLEAASGIASKIRQAVEDMPFEGSKGRPHYVTISLGVAAYPDHGDTPARVVSAADEALYQAKRQGRNQFVVAQ